MSATKEPASAIDLVEMTVECAQAGFANVLSRAKA